MKAKIMPTEISIDNVLRNTEKEGLYFYKVRNEYRALYTYRENAEGEITTCLYARGNRKLTRNEAIAWLELEGHPAVARGIERFGIKEEK